LNTWNKVEKQKVFFFFDQNAVCDALLVADQAKIILYLCIIAHKLGSVSRIDAAAANPTFLWEEEKKEETRGHWLLPHLDTHVTPSMVDPE
jgi:hypothetical protein